MASSKARSRNRTAPGKGRASGPSAPAARAQAAATQPVVAATPTSPAKTVNPARPAGQARPVKPARGARPAEQAAAVAPEPVRPSGPPLWLQLTSLVLAVLGLAVSAYETYAHFNGSHLAGCSANPHSTFDCTAVITSSQSMVFGVIPVAILGLVFYVFVVAIMTPWAWRMDRLKAGPLRLHVGWLRLAAMITGMGFVMYLIYAELYQIQQVCEYCTGVHIITFLLFCVTLVSAAIWGLGKTKTAA
jgi:uncharacterized membrane protein